MFSYSHAVLQVLSFLLAGDDMFSFTQTFIMKCLTCFYTKRLSRSRWTDV
jgi:hypothetical protein